MITLFIGNKNYSSWSLRGWLAMKKAGLQFDEVVIPLRTPETKSTLLGYNPEGGQVPFVKVTDRAIRTKSYVIYDSLAIAEWSADQASHLWPSDLNERAEARAAVSLMHSGFKHLRRECPMNIKMVAASPCDNQLALEDAAQIDKLWQDWLSRSGGPFLFGDWSLADAFYAPVVTRFVSWRLPCSQASQSYIDHALGDPHMLVWKDAAERESWTFDDMDASMR